MTEIWFPRLNARDLDGRQVVLPAGLPGEWNVVIVAFRRQRQALVDSWAPWLEEQEAAIPGLGFVEVPAIGRRWQSARPVIDGGMAAAIRDRQTRQRTLTVYADLRRMTVPLGIADRDTIWLFLTDRAGRVRWRGSGGWDAATAAALAAVLAEPLQPAEAATQAAGPGAEQFEMEFDPRFRLPLAALGITPATAHVTVTPSQLVACFGPWTCHTALANVRGPPDRPLSLAPRDRPSAVAGRPRPDIRHHHLPRGLPPPARTCARHRPDRPDPPPLPDTYGHGHTAIRLHSAGLRGPATKRDPTPA